MGTRHMFEADYRVVQDEDIIQTTPFLLSWGDHPVGLRRSLERIGQCTPLILQPFQGGLRLLCGVRRRQILREMGVTDFPAYIVPESLSDLAALELALEDNLGHRVFNEAEKVLAVKHWSRYYGDRELIRDHLPRLGLPPRREILTRYQGLALLEAEELTDLARGVIDPETGEWLLGMNREDHQAVCGLLRDLRPNRNKRKQMVAWLIEIGRREDRPLIGILGGPEIRAILQNERLSRPQKEERVRRQLRGRRYPELTRLEHMRAARLKALALPEQVRLQASPDFEGLEFTLSITFSDLRELRNGAGVAARLADHPDMIALMELG